MQASRPRFTLEVVWYDSDLLELSLSTASALFAGKVRFYAAHDALATFAGAIEGFPRSREDVREYEFGNPGMGSYGGARIRLYCRDAMGHLIMRVISYSTPSSPEQVVETVTVQLNLVPAAIDSFVEELKAAEVRVGSAAALRCET